MQDKIKAQLRAKFPGVNLSQARIDAIADKLATKITDESEIEAKLDELNDLHPFAEVAKYDDWQRAKQTKKPAQQQQQTTQTQEPADEPDMKTMFADLKKEIESLKKEKQAQALQDTLLKKVTEKKIPAAFIKGRTIESAEQLDTVLAEIETDFTAVKQELVNQGFSQQSAPVGGISTVKSDSIDKDIQDWSKKTTIPSQDKK